MTSAATAQKPFTGEIILSEKQSEAEYYLEDDVTTEVLFGGGAGCFTGDTPIATKRGHIPISEVRIGDRVLSLIGIEMGYNPVAKLYSYQPNHRSHKMITFEFHDFKIQCTYDHKFYYEGDWIAAYRLAWRAMEMGRWNKSEVCNIQQGQTNDDMLEGGRKDSARNNEASIFERIYENGCKEKWKACADQDSQTCSSGVYTEPRKQTNGESFELRHKGQFYREFGVGDMEGKRRPRIRGGKNQEADMYQLCEGIQDRYVKTNGATSKRDTTKVQTTGIHKTNAGRGIRSGSGHDSKHSTASSQLLGARGINLSEITGVIFWNYSGIVYDLQVEYSQNYCVSKENVIVHNSGKSMFGCAWQLKRRLMYPDTRGMIGRRTLKDLKDTTLMTFWDVCLRMGLKANVHYRYQSQVGRISFPNGSLIFLRELEDRPSDPDFGDLGSLELTDLFIDQAEQISRKAVQIARSRIRYNLVNGLRKTLLSANPANNWIKHHFVSDKNNNPIHLPKHRKFVRALVTDNPDPDFVAHYSANLDELDHYDRQRLKFGDWSVIENDRPFFDLFSEKRNVSKFALKRDPHSPLWLSFDFNLNPTTCKVGQKLDNVGARTYDCLEAIGTEALCHRVKELYGKHPAGLLVCGDHSGGSGSSSAGILPGGVYNTDFEQIKIILGLTDQDFIDTKTANARHEYSRRLCRHFLSKVPYLIDGTNERCQALISDLRNAKYINGRLYKNRTDGNEQDYGDGFRYWVNAMFQGDFSIIEDYAASLK